MAVIGTGNHPKSLWPGVKHWFGRKYDEYSPQYTDLCTVETSDKAYEEEVESTGFGIAGIKPQGESINYQTDSQGYTSRWTNVTYGSGFIVTEEELEDDLYEEVSKRRAPNLAFSLRIAKENVVAQKFNRGFNVLYPGGDGSPLISATHGSIFGPQSNQLTTSADISETAIEDLLIQIKNATDARGLPIRLMSESLHVPNASEFEALRIYNSVLQNDTANNAVNVLKMSGTFPKGIKANRFFTSTSAWFIRTTSDRGMTLYQRRPVRIERDSDFDTSNAKTKATERYSVNWGDWREWFGAPSV